MSTDFAPNFQKKFHAQIVPGLLTFLEDNENPRVQAHAGMFLIVSVGYEKDLESGAVTVSLFKLNSMFTYYCQLQISWDDHQQEYKKKEQNFN